MKLKMALATLALLVTIPAFAQSKMTGMTFLKGCKDFATRSQSSDTDYEQGFCSGMLYAISEQRLLFQRQRSFCIPKDVSVGQLALILVKYMEDNPDTLNLDLNMIAMLSLHSVWRCPKD